MKAYHNITEYQQTLLEGYQLTAEEREYLSALATVKCGNSREQRFSFQEWPTGLHLETYSWVGVIELVKVKIIIQPKFNHGFESLLDMICFINKIPFYQQRETTSELGKSDLMEIFITYFLLELDKILKAGVVKEYITEEDNLRQLRGRPDFIGNLRKNHNLPAKIYCRYDELVTDVVENQVLLLALNKANAFNLTPATKKKLGRFQAEFNMLCQPYQQEVWPDIHYHRLNAHYRTAHQLAYYIVTGVSVSNFYRFREQSYCSMLIDMNKLFEDFLLEILRRYFPKTYQVKGQSRVKEAILLNGESYRHIKPDLIVT